MTVRTIVALICAMLVADRALAADHPGAAVYQTYCMSCHGANLEGATGLPLNDSVWKHGFGVEAISRSIKQGFPEIGMPAFQGLIADDDIAAVADFIIEQQVGLRDVTVAVHKGDWKSGPALSSNEKWTAEAPIALTDHSVDCSEEVIGVKGGAKGRSYAALFAGQLYVPADGLYRFELAADGMAWVAVDGKLVHAFNNKKKKDNKKYGEVELKAGPNPCEIGYATGGGRKRGNGGVLVTVSGAELSKFPLHSTKATRKVEVAVEWPIVVGEFPVIDRHLLKDLPPNLMTIGFPGGASLTIDTESPSVLRFWAGDFVNIGPHVSGRGKSPANPGATSEQVSAWGPATWTWADGQEAIIHYRSVTSSANETTLVFDCEGYALAVAIQAHVGGYRWQLTGPALPQALTWQLASTQGISVSGAAFAGDSLTLPAGQAIDVTLTVGKE